MAFATVTKKGIDTSKHTFASSKSVFIPNKDRQLILKSGITYKFRIVPNNMNEAKYPDEYTSFAIAVPQHYGVGQNSKESVLCPQNIAKKLKIKCPLCAEFAEKGPSSSRACTKVYYYMRVVLMNKIEGINNYKEDGKTFIVYTIKVPKKSVIDVLFDYYDDEERAIPDIADLAEGCTIAIKVSKVTIDAGGKPVTVPNYSTTISEASRGSLLKLIKSEDVTDLRDYTEYVPTTKAILETMEGLPLAEAVAAYGKINTSTGKQEGGVVETTTATEAHEDLPDTSDIRLEATEDVELVETEA